MASIEPQSAESQPKPTTTSSNDTTRGTKRKREDSEPVPSDWRSQTRVLIGPNEEAFLVHTHILRKIPFFRGCLDAEMREKQEGVIRMPEDNPNVFTLLAHWAYHHELPFDIDKIRADAIPTGGGNNKLIGWVFHKKFALLLQLYFMASRLMIEELQNHIVDVVQLLNTRVIFSWSSHKAVVDNTTQDDPMRRLMMQHLSWDVFKQGGWRAWKALPKRAGVLNIKGPEHTDYIAEALTTFPNSKLPSTTADEPCEWHVHIDTPKCNE